MVISCFFDPVLVCHSGGSVLGMTPGEKKNTASQHGRVHCKKSHLLKKGIASCQANALQGGGLLQPLCTSVKKGIRPYLPRKALN